MFKVHRHDFATNVNPDWTALLWHFDQDLHSLLFYSCKTSLDWFRFNPVALRKAKIAYKVYILCYFIPVKHHWTGSDLILLLSENPKLHTRSTFFAILFL